MIYFFTLLARNIQNLYIWLWVTRTRDNLPRRSIRCTLVNIHDVTGVLTGINQKWSGNKKKRGFILFFFFFTSRILHPVVHSCACPCALNLKAFVYLDETPFNYCYRWQGMSELKREDMYRNILRSYDESKLSACFG